MGWSLVRSRLYIDYTIQVRAEKLPMFRFEVWCQSVESKLFYYLLIGGWEGGIKASSLNKVSRAELHAETEASPRLVSRRSVLSIGEAERTALSQSHGLKCRQHNATGAF
jgi:hypothetical protein